MRNFNRVGIGNKLGHILKILNLDDILALARLGQFARLLERLGMTRTFALSITLLLLFFCLRFSPASAFLAATFCSSKPLALAVVASHVATESVSALYCW
jgi:hypothetical protein